MKARLLTPILSTLLFLAGSPLRCQTDESGYMWPKDPAVLENLQKWQGYKFGLLIHMGLYSELGTVESWGLCPEDWVSRPGYDDYCQYASDYRNAKSRFNPVDFDPARWARGFRSSGARYVIYSTKHHDGFCLYDTRYTDFKVTDPGCPFSSNPRANVYREVLNACRAEGLVVGAYFSKPDWTTPFFWWPYYPPKDRNPSYDITKHPDRWRNFVEFTQNQIHEITTEYGPIDILWLDGCWVLPKSAITPKVAEFCQYPHDMDINMKKIAEQARAANPGMLVVDRWVEGEFENYLTPEQRTPDKALAVPWESCITMGHAWGWVPNDRYKSARELVQLLIGVVAKGGNLLLGVGPDGTGKFEPAVFQRFEELGRWLAVNGEAIYDTHPVEPFQEGRMAYTAGANNTIHALYMLADGESELPEYLDVSTTLKGRIRVTQLSSGKTLSHRPIPGGIRISIPKNLGKMLATEEAVVFRLKSE